uniref:Lipase_3 domain-containing protein n=1 Tax=Parastrongyloides trichosuri TaxID=131310 RepID=A0A0N4ZLX3_PARTI
MIFIDIILLIILFNLTTTILPQRPAMAIRTGYNQDEAKMLFMLSAGAYSINPEPCVARTFSPTTKYILFNNHTETCDSGGNICSFYTIVSEIEKKIIITFRGTKNKDQLLREGLASLRDGIDFYGVGLVNRYFFKAHNTLWDDVIKIYENPAYNGFKVYITGHSLGGALAALAAIRTQIEGYRSSEDITLYTFGEPRVGSPKFAFEFDRLIPKSWRVVHRLDIVPHLPACEKDKNSRLVKFSKDDSKPCNPYAGEYPYHHGTEIWYPTGMGENDTYYECTGSPKNEDFDCSDSLSFELSKYSTYISDHRHYFDHKITSFGKLGCVANARGYEEMVPDGAEIAEVSPETVSNVGTSNSAPANAWHKIVSKVKGILG